MNQFLKALIQELYDLEQAGELAAAKSWAALVNAGIKAGMDLPALVNSVGQAQSDLQQLVTNPAADQDLLAFTLALVGNQGKAANIVAKSADLALSALQLEPKVEALVAAIKA